MLRISLIFIVFLFFQIFLIFYSIDFYSMEGFLGILLACHHVHIKSRKRPILLKFFKAIHRQTNGSYLDFVWLFFWYLFLHRRILQLCSLTCQQGTYNISYPLLIFFSWWGLKLIRHFQSHLDECSNLKPIHCTYHLQPKRILVLMSPVELELVAS